MKNQKSNMASNIVMIQQKQANSIKKNGSNKYQNQPNLNHPNN